MDGASVFMLMLMAGMLIAYVIVPAIYKFWKKRHSSSSRDSFLL